MSTLSTQVSLGSRLAYEISNGFQRDSGIIRERENGGSSARMFIVDNAWSGGQDLDSSHQESEGQGCLLAGRWYQGSRAPSALAGGPGCLSLHLKFPSEWP